MAASRDDIREWLRRGAEQGATHVIAVCDTYDYDDYPVFVKKGEDVREIFAKSNASSMQRVMEVYALHLDIESQLNEHRAFHFESAPEPTPTLEKEKS